MLFNSISRSLVSDVALSYRHCGDLQGIVGKQPYRRQCDCMLRQWFTNCGFYFSARYPPRWSHPIRFVSARENNGRSIDIRRVDRIRSSRRSICVALVSNQCRSDSPQRAGVLMKFSRRAFILGVLPFRQPRDHGEWPVKSVSKMQAISSNLI